MGLYADVVVSVPAREVDHPFTYAVPSALAGVVSAGAPVRVPFGSRTLGGFVVEVHDRAPQLEPGKLREILEVRAAEDFWGRELLALAQWMQEFYGCLLLDALRAIVPEPVRASLEKRRTAARGRVRVASLTDGVDEAHPLLATMDGDAAQAGRMIRVLAERRRVPPRELLDRAHARRDVLEKLRGEGLIRYSMVAEAEMVDGEDPMTPRRGLAPGGAKRPCLSEVQRRAVNEIVSALAERRPAVVLLHGVTGSGKTEVYLHALEEVIRLGRQGLVLVPEISLTPQAVDRYRTRLGDRVAVLHSGLSESERVDEWWRLKRGTMAVALGARSCVFAPVADLALVIVDEEHDSSYKQEQSPRYHARQVAIRRAISCGAVVVLGSATPSMETTYWAAEGRYRLVDLPDRVEGRPLPVVEVADMRRQGARPEVGGAPPTLGNVLRAHMQETLARGEQVMLLMNRRGFASYLMCQDCGHLSRCPRCDISLTYHVRPPALLCHYCLYEKTPPVRCPECSGVGLVPFGSGTQRVEEEILEAFPGVGLARMDRDTMRRMADHRRVLERFARREVQVLLGTQMIAKGHDFPGVTLVGVVLADMALNLPDFRAAERTFSLLVQVAGRAGRGTSPGRVVIQTYNPKHPAIVCAAAQDYATFYQQELESRKELWYPPFSHLVNLVFAGEDESEVRAAALRARSSLQEEASRLGARLLGPAPCAIPRIHRKHRWHLVFKAWRVQEIMPMIRKYLGSRPAADLQITVDADPVSML